MLFADVAIVGRNAVAVVGVRDLLLLIDQVADQCGMGLVFAEHNGLLAWVDVAQELQHPEALARFDLDGDVEFILLEHLTQLHLAFNHGILTREDVVVNVRSVALHLERREEAIIDAFLETVGVHRVAEIAVGVRVHIPLGRGSKTQLCGGFEILQDAAPSALVVRASPVTLIDNDKVEEVRGIVTEVRRTLRPAHERLEDREEHTAIGGHLALLADVVRVDPYQRIIGERAEGVVGLVGQDVAVGQEEDARATFPITLHVPTRMEELPSDLEGDGRFARAGGQGEQDALLVRGDGVQHPLNGQVLVVARLPASSLVFEGYGTKALLPIHTGLATGLAGLQPGIWATLERGEPSKLPQLIRGWPAVHVPFTAGEHVHLVLACAIAAEREAGLQLVRVLFGLPQAVRYARSLSLGLQGGQHAPFVFKDVVGDVRGVALASSALQPSQRDVVLPADACALHHAPARRAQRRVYEFGAGFGFVHAFTVSYAWSG